MIGKPFRAAAMCPKDELNVQTIPELQIYCEDDFTFKKQKNVGKDIRIEGHIFGL